MALELVHQQHEIGLNQEALAEWIEYRREYSKKPMSAPAIKKATNKLLQWSEADQQRIVDEAIEREWTGLYWVEPPKNQTSRNSNLHDDLTDTSWAR